MTLGGTSPIARGPEPLEQLDRGAVRTFVGCLQGRYCAELGVHRRRAVPFLLRSAQDPWSFLDPAGIEQPGIVMGRVCIRPQGSNVKGFT